MNNLPKRKSIRLKHYDYSLPGRYYVTICTQDRRCLFGEISGGEMILNDAGKIINRWWLEIQERFKNVALDQYQITPNHIHGVAVIVGVGLPNPRGDGGRNGRGNPAPTRMERSTLGQIIAYFKYQSTKQINALRGTPGKRLWQRNFYENIIRTKNDLRKIRKYIENNPQMWDRDRNNPQNWL